VGPKGRERSLIVLMVVAVAAVAVLAFWDEQRESAAALDDFAQDQAALAGSVASELDTRLAAVRRDARTLVEGIEEGRRAPSGTLEGAAHYTLRAAGAPAPDPGPAAVAFAVSAGEGRVLDLLVPTTSLLEGPVRVERPDTVRLLVRAPGDAHLRRADGRAIEVSAIERALATSGTVAWLTRTEAPALGLHPRLAAAGLAHVDAGPLGRWAVAVVTSAERVRDRERRAKGRLVLGVLLAAGLVFAFGSAALRRQRRGLTLERELALAALARERDVELGTKSRAATLGTLAMGIAHEISTPLGVIAGRAEQLLPKVESDPRAARAVQAIIDQAERIRRVIRAFLDVVRGGAPALGETPPAAVLEGALTLVEHRFAAAGVGLTLRIAPDLPAIRGDRPLLQQAVVNLLLNACDACARGGHVAATVAAEGDLVRFTVTDDGRGITAEEATRATEPFFTTTAPAHGSGLGLAIVNEIVKMHRGTLTLGPAEPRGTAASIALPRAGATGVTDAMGMAAVPGGSPDVTA
jgi:two-component system NtrC family sensor kinase